MTPESIEHFFDDYAAALSHGDAQELTRLWKLPAFITTRTHNRCITDAEELLKTMELQCAFYLQRGLTQARKTIVNISSLCAGVAFVTTWDELLDAAGKPIAQWQNGHLVRETDSGLRAIAVVGDKELSAPNSVAAFFTSNPSVGRGTP
jgi:hypothetical protein